MKKLFAIMTISALDLFRDVDIIQVGARNMQNFDLLQELGKTKKPILRDRLFVLNAEGKIECRMRSAESGGRN